MFVSAGNIIDGKFELRSPIGHGGMGIVYEAHQLGLGRIVALKLLYCVPEDSKDEVLRFEREALILSKLSHANIVQFYAYGTWSGLPYIAMERLLGDSLQKLLGKNGPLSLPDTIEYARQICDGLEHAHAHGIFHRDIKPTNIIISRGPDGRSIVKIIDFGLAKLTAIGIQKLTQANTAMGSVLYMSPEQCTAQTVDLRSDIYSLGCLLYHCLTGEPPFGAENAVAVMFQQMNDPVQNLPGWNRLPGALQHVVARCMAKEPADRFQSCGEVRDSLIQAAQSESIAIGNQLDSAIPPQLSRKRTPKHWIFAATFMLMIMFSCVFLSKSALIAQCAFAVARSTGIYDYNGVSIPDWCFGIARSDAQATPLLRELYTWSLSQPQSKWQFLTQTASELATRQLENFRSAEAILNSSYLKLQTTQKQLHAKEQYVESGKVLTAMVELQRLSVSIGDRALYVTWNKILQDQLGDNYLLLNDGEKARSCYERALDTFQGDKENAQLHISERLAGFYANRMEFEGTAKQVLESLKTVRRNKHHTRFEVDAVTTCVVFLCRSTEDNWLDGYRKKTGYQVLQLLTDKFKIETSSPESELSILYSRGLLLSKLGKTSELNRIRDQMLRIIERHHIWNDDKNVTIKYFAYESPNAIPLLKRWESRTRKEQPGSLAYARVLLALVHSLEYCDYLAEGRRYLDKFTDTDPCASATASERSQYYALAAEHYTYLADYKSSVRCYKKSIALASTIPGYQKIELARLTFGLGANEFWNGDLQAALSNCSNAANDMCSAKNWAGAGQSYRIVGLICLQENDIKGGVDVVNKMFECSRQMPVAGRFEVQGSPRNIVMSQALRILAECQIRTNENEKAESSVLKALKLLPLPGTRVPLQVFLLGETYDTFTHVQIAKKQFRQAKQTGLVAIRQWSKWEEVGTWADARERKIYNGVALFHFAQILQQERQWQEASKYYAQAIPALERLRVFPNALAQARKFQKDLQ